MSFHRESLYSDHASNLEKTFKSLLLHPAEVRLRLKGGQEAEEGEINFKTLTRFQKDTILDF